MKTSCLLSVLFLSTTSFAAEPKSKSKAASSAEVKKAAKAMEISLPPMGGVPATDGLTKPKAEIETNAPKVTATSAIYTVVHVLNGKAFNRGPNGATVAGKFESVALSGNPPSTERFTTVVRVKSAQRQNAPIDLVILDPRGDTVMKARGEVNFRGTQSDEVDYTVDWDSTPWPKAGEFQTLVRIAGQVMGTYPLKVEVK
ncbi:MAG: DUF6941 family protein [Myxococcaceae bacterium]